MNISVKKQFSLQGKNVLITGGAGFLGYHFAEAIAEMDGYPIILDKSQDAIDNALKMLEQNSFSASGYETNITDPTSIEQSISRIVKKHPNLDVLINAAQNTDDDSDEAFEDYELKYWQESINVNLTGTFLVTQAVGKIMKAQKSGVIVNVASDVALISPDHRVYQPDKRFDYEGVTFNNPIDYSVCKAGLLAFTRFLATYWAKDGIRVNAISPAGVFRDHDPKFVEQLAFRIPLNRMAQPHELKGPMVFLCSDASSFMTGSNLVVDGGRSIW
jgi:NAD(P)-dependent dehydrogenase (short-subunit alcohol dehydrogenase family)